ncbi:AraC family transcriptional regulator [Prevotella intermedia ZT]|uniref:AraC family transcriptional regulator n=1 Tax=Prevotella intermedia ZT TaxID=1347790 RepID=A0AAP0YN94_PREIN|nr:AraC family transcriptional regulator [Prevotella intermedia ZT]
MVYFFLMKDRASLYAPIENDNSIIVYEERILLSEKFF